MKNNRAFSLLEMSIVLIIIAAIVGAVLGGRSLIASARLSNAVSLTANSPVLNIDGLILWLETSTLKSDHNNGDLIGEWVDMSPYKNNMRASGGRRPEFRESSGVLGQYALYFDGGKFLESEQFLNVGRYTVFVVARTGKNASPSEVVIYNGSGNGWGIMAGGLSANGLTIAESSRAPEVYAGNFYVGAKNGSNGFHGEIFELIIFERKLFTREIEDIKLYLHNKYRLK